MLTLLLVSVLSGLQIDLNDNIAVWHSMLREIDLHTSHNFADASMYVPVNLALV
jgi:hypothetical protein